MKNYLFNFQKIDDHVIIFGPATGMLKLALRISCKLFSTNYENIQFL